ncbi:MAG: hypothetical protein QOF02_3177 [Blastocatellia bacterium]|jgi:hypothetical protein|nr:hypothetical protein [Blastocatellia bacterium]
MQRLDAESGAIYEQTEDGEFFVRYCTPEESAFYGEMLFNAGKVGSGMSGLAQQRPRGMGDPTIFPGTNPLSVLNSGSIFSINPIAAGVSAAQNTLPSLSTVANGAMPSVRTLQAALNALPSSLPRLTVDGVMGPRTTARIAEYYRLNGMVMTGTVSAAVANRIVAAGVAAGGGNPAPSNNPNNYPGTFGVAPPSSSTNWWLYGGLAAVVLAFVMKHG